MTLGSLFDGIGTWLLSATHNNIKPVWSCEIDDFPSEVSNCHFPDVKQYGDITKISGYELEPVDIICAGSPCQDLSVAGRREGLSGERSGLFMEAIRIVREMRDKTNGEKPRYFVWENVPGAFSSNKGLDFRAVLEEISQTEIPIPQYNKWATAGMVEWNGGSLAWRVLDAQYWGVPQRRKRIFLVADFTNGCPREILFERPCLSRDFAKSQREGQETPRYAGASTDGSINGSDIKLITCYNMGQPSNNFEPYTEGGGVSPTLISRMGTGGNQVPLVHTYSDVASTLRAGAGVAKHMSDVHGRLVQTFPIEGNGGRPSHRGDGYCESDKMYTLNTIERHAVAVGFLPQHKAESMTPMVEKSPCLVNGTNPGWQNGVYQKTVGSLCADGHKGINNQYVGKDKCVIQKSVRRLTPTECERLQGLPDGYTNIEFNGKPAPDSRRYKALGNGMAQPCADYVIKRICLSAH